MDDHGTGWRSCFRVFSIIKKSCFFFRIDAYNVQHLLLEQINSDENGSRKERREYVDFIL